MKRTIWVNAGRHEKAIKKAKYFVGKEVEYMRVPYKILKVWGNGDISLAVCKENFMYECIYRVDPRIIENDEVLPMWIKKINDKSIEDKFSKGEI